MHLVLLGVKEGEELAHVAEHQVALGAGELGEGDVEADATGTAAAHDIQEAAVGRGGPRLDGIPIEGERGIGDDPVHVVIDGVAETLAAGAGAEWVVEAEQRRLGRGKLDVAGLAGELLAELEADGRVGAGLLEDDLADFAVNRSPGYRRCAGGGWAP